MTRTMRIGPAAVLAVTSLPRDSAMAGPPVSYTDPADDAYGLTAQPALSQPAFDILEVRWAPAGVGKRGGVRVIYYWAPGESVFYMLYIYAKVEQGDLTPLQVRALAKVVREEFK